MRLISLCFALAASCLFSVTAAEAACKPTGNVLFQDQFDTLAPSWGTYDNYHVENGKLVIQPPAGKDTATINTSSLYGDVEICAEMTVRPPVKPNNCGGVVFWAADYDNYYSLQVSTNGQAAVWQLQKGNWQNLVPWQDFAPVRRNAKQVNEILVRTAGKTASLFVNGKLFKQINGQPPAGGSQVGLVACSPTDSSAAVDFDNFNVAEAGGGAPPAVAAASLGAGANGGGCKPTTKTLFQDAFDQLAPSWGTFENYHVEGGKLVIQPPAGYNTATINNASLYDDVDICAEMAVAPPIGKGTCGAIIFWATDYDNYYSLQVSTDGQVSVWRRQKGKWLAQVAWADFSAVRTGAGQVNTLRVVTAGNKAQFFVNGQAFKGVTGQPPAGGSQVGLLACSPNDSSARVELDNFVVSTPGGTPVAAAAVAKADVGSGAVKTGAKCPTPKDALFTDRFDTLAASWGTFENYKVDNGEFLITPPAGYNTTALNTASLYDDVDLCVEMMARAPVPDGTCGAVVIWGEDYDNYYSFQVSTDGQASFWRRQRGKWLNQVGWQKADGVNTGDGYNQLRVTTSGGSAKLFINGQLFKEVQGEVPKNGQEIGLLACAGDKQASAVGFDNLVVTGVGAPPADKTVEAKVADNKAADKVVEDKPAAKVAENKVDDGGAPPDVKPLVQDDSGDGAPQGRRVALVIGIGAYKNVPALPNPPRDAAAIAAELQDLGFDVTHLENLDKNAMRSALQDFEDKASGAQVALVYYAGHGMEVKGVNYLIPADAVLAKESAIDDDTVSLPRVLLAVEHAQLRMVLLDACRNNPFPMVAADGTRAVSRGLARIRDQEVQKSTVIIFSAKEGATAEDGNGKNSPFATALLDNLKNPQLEINMLIRRVTDEVEKKTGGAQEPFVYASLTSAEVYLGRH